MSTQRRTTYRPLPRVDMLLDTDYMDYAVLKLGSAYVPVMVRDGWVTDAFTPMGSAITAYTTQDEAWELIAEDARAMGRVEEARG